MYCAEKNVCVFMDETTAARGRKVTIVAGILKNDHTLSEK
jgi:hypothetical protein